MKKFKFYSYKEIMLLIAVVSYLIIKQYPIQLIIIGTLSIGICLFLMKYFINRSITKNNLLLEQSKAKIEKFESNNTVRSSSTIDESGFKEELRILRKIISYARECSQFYNYKAAEAENYIDERCGPFLNLVAPILAVSPNPLLLVIQTRPSLELYARQKIEEYIKNKPALSEVKAEFQKICSTNFFDQNDTKSDLNDFTHVYLVVDKYGFSQELLAAAKEMNPEIYHMIFKIYDKKLNDIGNYYDFSYECHNDPDNAWKLR